MIKIKALNIIKSKEFIKEKFSEQALSKVNDSLNEEDKEALKSLLPSSWFPQDTWVRFYEAVIRELGAGDESIVKEIGYYTADKELKGILRIFLKFASPERIINKFPALMETYFSADEHKMEATATKLAENKYQISVKKFEPRHRLVELAMSGWMEASLKLAGAKYIKIDITKSLAQGEGNIEYVVSWE
jgi:hypothetical protein